jgi:Rieske Fe-S protein
VVACAGSLATPDLTSDVVIALADYPALASDGGRATIPSSVSGYDYPIYLTNEGGMFRALSGWCSHEACTVSRSGDGYRCACHGATFSSTGATTGGPAPRGLIAFDTESDGTSVTILANA